MVLPIHADIMHIVIANHTASTCVIDTNTVVASTKWLDIRDFNVQSINLLDDLDDTVDINNLNTFSSQSNSTYSVPDGLSISKNLTPSQTKSIINLLQEHDDIFAKANEPLPDCQNQGVQHTINTEGAIPKSCSPRRISHIQKTTVSEHIKVMLNGNIIQPSRSPWASPVLLVPKKNGEWRFCIDYRTLNDATVKDVYPLPRIDDTLDALNGAKFLSTLDLQSGYWQIPMAKDSIQKTAFVTHEGLFEYKRMPFGLCNAPATFQRHLDSVLAGLKWQCCLVYIDDIIVFSSSFEQHMIDIRLIFNRLREHGLKLNAKKCFICCNKVTFLGHSITPDGIRPDPAKMSSIRLVTFSEKPEKQRMLSFIGLVGHYRKFIQDFSKIVLPLRLIAHKDNPWIWDETCETNFNLIKEKLTSGEGPILALPNFKGEYRFSVHTDASDAGIGAVLYQSVNGSENVIQYASRSLTPAELKWNTTEKEALAIVWACDHFRPYLIGTAFDVETDHQSLAWLKKSEKGRLARWAMKLEEYNPTIRHRPGKQNVVPDYLSRYPTTSHGSSELEIPELDINFIVTSESGYLLAINEFNENLDNSQTNSTGTMWDCTSFIAEIIKNYEKDIQCRDIILYHTNTDFREANIYRKERFLSFTLLPNGLLSKIGKDDSKQIVIPRDSRMNMLRHFHDNRLMGHLGRDKTHRKMANLVWWPKLYRDVRKFVATCERCQLHKSNTQPKNRLLFPSEPSCVWSTAHIDLVGPLPESENGMRYICVITDAFTKWVEAVAIPNKSEDTVAEAIFNNLICRHSVPRRIRTDQGTEFTNKLLKRLLSRMDIAHDVGCPYYPQANGQVERFNKTLIESLAAQCDNEPSKWNHYLEGVLFGYRTSQHSELQCSPFEMLYGRKPILPMELLFGNIDKLNEDVQLHKTRLTYNLVRSHQLIQKLLRQVAETRKDKWNSNARPLAISTGDSVLVKKPMNIKG
jgi:transposase InsO family protein